MGTVLSRFWWGAVAAFVVVSAFGLYDQLSPATASSESWASIVLTRAVVHALGLMDWMVDPSFWPDWRRWLIGIIVLAVVTAPIWLPFRNREALLLQWWALAANLVAGPGFAAAGFGLAFSAASLGYFLEPWSLVSGTGVVVALALLGRRATDQRPMGWLLAGLTLLLGIHVTVVTHRHLASYLDQRFLGTETRVHSSPAYAVALGTSPDHLYVTDRETLRRLNRDADGWRSQCLAHGTMLEHIALAPKRGSIFVTDSAKGTFEFLLDAPDSPCRAENPDDSGARATEVATRDSSPCQADGQSSLDPVDDEGPEESSCANRVPHSVFQGEGANWPTSIVIDRDEKLLVAAHEWDGQVSFFDLESDALLSRFSVFQPRGFLPFLHWEPTSQRLFATTMAGTGELAELDPGKHEVSRATPGVFAHGLAFDGENNRVWAARAFFNRLIEIDGGTLRPVRWRRVNVGSMIRDLEFDPHTGLLLFSTFPAGDIFAYDPDEDSVARVGNCGWMCRGLVLDREERRLVAGSERGVFMLELDHLAEPGGMMVEQERPRR